MFYKTFYDIPPQCVKKSVTSWKSIVLTSFLKSQTKCHRATENPQNRSSQDLPPFILHVSVYNFYHTQICVVFHTLYMYYMSVGVCVQHTM